MNDEQLLRYSRQIMLPQIDAAGQQNGLKTYRVEHGDSPFEIAVRHNMSLDRLLRMNNLTTRSTIYPGQKLVVE